MSRSTDNVIRLVKAGGTLSINCGGRSPDNVLRIISAANASGKPITSEILMISVQIMYCE